LLGLSLAAPPGPVNAIIASKSLRNWQNGAMIGFGALTADMTFMVITIFFGELIPESAVPLISFGGGIFLAWLAYSSLRSEASYTHNQDEALNGKSYFVGLTMGLTNPFQIMWWVSVGVPLVRNLGTVIFLGFVLGIALWVFSFSFLVNKFGVSHKFAFAVKLFSFVTLSFFSLYFFYRALPPIARWIVGFMISPISDI